MRLAPPDGAPYDRNFVKAYLEAAGATLLSLPVSGLPPRYRVAWPEIVRSVEDLAQQIEDDNGRPPAPTAKRIDEMDAAIGWIALIDGAAVQTRRLVWLRLMVNPMTDRYVWSWRKLQKRIGLNKDTLMQRHNRGLDRIVTRLNRPEWRALPGDTLP